MSKVIVFATPVFILLIALEFIWSRRATSRTAGQTPFRLSDAINSISLGMLSQVAGVLGRVLSVGIYVAVFESVALFPRTDFWNSALGVLLALVMYDFCYYWLHRAGHVVALFWAAHVVHHQSQHYNLSTALRQTSSGLLFGWIFYLPMAVLGVPPTIFGIVLLIDLLYQFWVHTEQVGKLGWFDRVFCSPSNHRVHHAVNDGYIDKNYGGILMLWDHLFGSFQEEKDNEPCVYGTRGALNSWDPLWANLEVYAALARDSWRTPHWGDKLLVWFKPPGWQSAGMARSNPKQPFTLESVVTFNPPLSPAQQWFATLQFVLAMGVVLAYLWHVDAMPLATAGIWAAAISAGLWATGRFMQGSFSMIEVLTVECAALSTLAALGMLDGYMLFKPLTMVFAIVFVVTRAYSTGAIDRFGRFDLLLVAALVFSLGGDVFLMLPGNYFIPGLASFLVAHLFYIALLRQGQAWFPNRQALAAVLAVGATMYSIVWGGLGDAALKIAVAAYVTIISLMTAQAIGRAAVLGNAPARWVALGACVFMVSDSLIAINKFVTPVALSSLWILATYYCAQMLIVHNARPEVR
jgi:alkylglycerol monooxygenase